MRTGLFSQVWIDLVAPVVGEQGAVCVLILYARIASQQNKMKYVNVTKERCTHYVGRKTSYRRNGVDYSILGNPFPLPKYSREESIQQFRYYLNNERKNKSQVWQALLALPQDAVLGCFCAPLRCHCSVIIDAYRWANAP